MKIMEIIATGQLRRIEYEKTDDIEVMRLFQGVYGAGQLSDVHLPMAYGSFVDRPSNSLQVVRCRLSYLGRPCGGKRRCQIE